MKNLNFLSNQSDFGLENGSGMTREWLGIDSTVSRKLFTLLFVLLLGFSQMWGALTEEYSYTFSAKQFNNNTTAQTLGSITWTPATSWKSGSGYWGYDATKGQQWGSSSNTMNTLTLTAGTSISNIKKITINASTASSGYCKLSVKVGNTTIGSEESLTSTATPYDFESATGLSGAVQIKMVNNSKAKAQYIKSITIYTEASSTPALNVSKTSITSGLTYVSGSGPSSAQTFTVSGTSLGGNVTVSAPTNFEVSKNGSNYNSSQTITASGTLDETTVYVRLKSGLAVNSYSGNITVSSSGATSKTVSLSGSVTAPTPSLSRDPASLNWSTVNKGAELSTKTFTISGSNLTGNLSVSATGGYTVSCGSSITVTNGAPSVTSITVTPPSTSTAGTKNGTITISGGGASSVSVSCSLTVNEIDQFIDDVQNTSGYSSANPHIAAGSYGTTPSLSDKAVATSGTCEQQHYHFVGWITAAKYEEGTSIADGDLKTPTSATGETYYAVWAKQAAGGSSNTISLTYSDFGYTGTTYSTQSVTKGGFSFTCKQGCRSNSPYSLQMNSSKTGHLYNTTAITGLQSVTLKCNATNTGKTATIYQGSSSEPTATSAGTAACEESKNYTVNITSGSYFTIAVSGATYFSEVIIAYSTVTYEDYIAHCCTPLVSINGSFNRYHLKIFHHIIMSMFISLIFKC